MSSMGSISALDFRNFYGEGIYSEVSEIPVELVEILRPPAKMRPDYLRLLSGGLHWITEPLMSLQPHSYAALFECAGPIQLGMKLVPQRFPSDPASAFEAIMFECSGQMVEIRPSFDGDTYERGDDCFGSLLALPDGLAKSWLWRTEGWRIPGEPYGGLFVNRKLVTHPSYGWPHTDDYLDSLGRGWKKKFLPSIVEMFPDCLKPATEKSRGNLYMFRCFLDTRPANVFAPTGDQFFVISTRRDQVVYHIHEGDITNLRVLHDPDVAIDRYSAYTLRNLPGEFDFSPWSEPYVP